jgi:hypothetical protein
MTRTPKEHWHSSLNTVRHDDQASQRPIEVGGKLKQVVGKLEQVGGKLERHGDCQAGPAGPGCVFDKKVEVKFK